MIPLALYLIAGIALVLIPALIVARFFEWRAWDNDRRIARLRDRRLKT